MKSVERVVSIYKTNSRMGRGSNSSPLLDYFEGEKNKLPATNNGKTSTSSFDKILQAQIKKSSLR